MKRSRTDWARLDALEDESVDRSDIPELTPEMFAKAIVRRGLKPVTKKSQVTLRVDSDVLTWFKTQGNGYQTRINTLLRAYMDAQKKQSANVAQRERRKSPSRRQRIQGSSASPRR